VDDPRSRRRLRDEARITAGLCHPGIAQVYGWGDGEVDGTPTPYIVMEFVCGMSLLQHLGGKRPMPGFAMRVGAAVAAALARAHAAGLVHRDVKPGNTPYAGSPHRPDTSPPSPRVNP
jgi:serine/threonine protein kinase